MTQVLSTSLRATDQDIDDYLMHYGVKGMRWGVRKDRNKSGGTGTKKKTSSSESTGKQGSDASSKSGSNSGSTKSSKKLTTDQMITRVNNFSSEDSDILNRSKEIRDASKTVKANTGDGPLKKVLEFHPQGLEVVNKAADNLGIKSNLTKSKSQLETERRMALSPEDRKAENDAWRAKEDRIRRRNDAIAGVVFAPLHAAIEIERRKQLKREGKIKHIESDIDDYLMHYGVKGMKWGVRKDDRGKVKSVLKRDFKAKEDTEFDAIREVSKPVDKSIGRFKKIYKNANPNIKKSIRNINQIPEYKDADLTNPKNKLTKKYHSEINKAVTKQLNSSSVLVNRNVKQGFIPIFEYDTSRGNRVKGMHQIAPGNPLTSKDAKDLALGSQRGVLNTKDRVLRTAHKVAIAASMGNNLGIGTVNSLGAGVAAAAAYTRHGPSRSTADMFVPEGLESLANDAGVSARSPLGIKLFGGNANDVEIMKRKRMQHAAGSDYDILVGLVYKIDNNGQVYDFEADVMASKEDVQHDEMNDIDDYLMHYGVKGMKWGVRKDLKKKKSVYERSEYIAKKDAKWRSNVSNPKKAIRVAKRASREATRMTKELNAKYKKQGYKIGGNPMRKKSLDNRRNKLARAQYDTELKGILEYSLDKAAHKVYKNSPTRLYQVNLSRSSDGTLKAKVAPRQNAKLDKQRAAITKRNMRIKHSDEADDVVDLNGLEFELTQDSDGFVTSVGVPGDDLEHDELNDLDIDDYLMHYGVKGMKWGVRKDGKPQGYQGGGGSSKSKKKKKSSTVDRVKSNLKKTSRSAKKKVSKISEANKDRKEARAKAKAAAKAKPKAKRELDVDKAQTEARAIEAERKSNPTLHSPDTTKTILTDRSRTGAMTDAELKATIQRMHLENTYAKLVREATPKTTSQKLKEFAKATAVDIAKQQVKRVAGDYVGNLVDKAVKGGVEDAKEQKKKKESEPKADTPKSESKPKADTPKSESKPKSDSKPTPDSKPKSDSKPAPTWRPTPPSPGNPPNKPVSPTWRPTPAGPGRAPNKPNYSFENRGRNYKGTRRAQNVIDNNASVTVAELMERRKRRQR